MISLPLAVTTGTLGGIIGKFGERGWEILAIMALSEQTRATPRLMPVSLSPV